MMQSSQRIKSLQHSIIKSKGAETHSALSSGKHIYTQVNKINTKKPKVKSSMSGGGGSIGGMASPKSPDRGKFGKQIAKTSSFKSQGRGVNPVPVYMHTKNSQKQLPHDILKQTCQSGTDLHTFTGSNTSFHGNKTQPLG